MNHFAFHPDNIRLRRTNTDDISALNHLIHACCPSDGDYLDALHKLITGDDSYVFCVDDPATHTPVACVGVAFGGSFDDGFSDDVAHIYPWVVLPHLQGKGIGRVLLSAIRTFATRHAKSRGISALSLLLTNADTHPSDFAIDKDIQNTQGLIRFKSPLWL